MIAIRVPDIWELELFVAGRPAPQGSKMARPIYRGRGSERVFTGKVAQVESSKSGVDAWRSDVRAAAEAVWPVNETLDVPLVVSLEFVMPRPASAPKRSTPPASKRPDLSKLCRATEDALESAGVFVDDARIVTEYLSKRIAEIGETPGCHIRVGRADA